MQLDSKKHTFKDDCEPIATTFNTYKYDFTEFCWIQPASGELPTHRRNTHSSSVMINTNCIRWEEDDTVLPAARNACLIVKCDWIVIGSPCGHRTCIITPGVNVLLVIRHLSIATCSQKTHLNSRCKGNLSWSSLTPALPHTFCISPCS